eukprot:GHVQ01007974.1.p1 GENE.GHVQ01007974.1~~GHVQ01007974.1.p1  ORF type:complete len:299 (-),score=62.06 GHVQ01007974.1:246-1142(-)
MSLGTSPHQPNSTTSRHMSYIKQHATGGGGVQRMAQHSLKSTNSSSSSYRAEGVAHGGGSGVSGGGDGGGEKRAEVDSSTRQHQHTVMFDCSKKPSINVINNYKIWLKKLRQTYKCIMNKEPLCTESLSSVHLIIVCAPTAMYSSDELNAAKLFITSGKSVMVLLGEGGEERNHTNINYLLEEFGIMVNSDAVLRAAYKTYFHPKEALVTKGVTCDGLLSWVHQHSKPSESATKEPPKADFDPSSTTSPHFDFLFPYGASLNVQMPAVTIAMTGAMCYPFNRPIIASYDKDKDSGYVI